MMLRPKPTGSKKSTDNVSAPLKTAVAFLCVALFMLVACEVASKGPLISQAVAVQPFPDEFVLAPILPPKDDAGGIWGVLFSAKYVRTDWSYSAELADGRKIDVAFAPVGRSGPPNEFIVQVQGSELEHSGLVFYYFARIEGETLMVNDIGREPVERWAKENQKDDWVKSHLQFEEGQYIHMTLVQSFEALQQLHVVAREELLPVFRVLADGPQLTTEDVHPFYELAEGFRPEAAARFYLIAAEHGHAASQARLGMQYLEGNGVDKNPAEALSWFRRAASANEPEAFYGIGLLYESGEGVPQDDAEALAWYQMAANSGSAEAAFRIGQRYESGDGVETDRVQALEYFRMAATMGHEGAQEKLTAIAEAPVCGSNSELVHLVQQSLRDQLGANDLNVTGEWNIETEQALRTYLNRLLGREPWSTGWTVSIENLPYSESVSAHLRQRIAGVEEELGGPQTFTEGLLTIVNPMDCLLSAGAYPFHTQPPDPVPQTEPVTEQLPPVATPPPASGDHGLAILTTLFNGATLEFGDDAWCAFLSDNPERCKEGNRQRLLAAMNASPIAFGIANAIGILLSPFGLAAIGKAARSKTYGEAFGLGFKAEVGEGIVAFIGEVVTFGEALAPGGWVVFTAIAGLVTGLACVWAAKKHEIIEGMKTLAVLGILALIAYAWISSESGM